MAVVLVLSILLLIGKNNVQVGASIHSDNRSNISIHLNHHPNPGKIDTTTAPHVINELLFLSSYNPSCYKPQHHQHANGYPADAIITVA